MVIMDSGFFVLNFFIGIYKRGVYGSEVVKKSIYWPLVIYVDQINAHKKKEIGEHLFNSVNCKEVDFGAFFCKISKLQHDNDVYVL